MEAPMKRDHFIGLDSHGGFCHMLATNSNGKRAYEGRCATTISAVREMIDKVPRPRHLVFEEGRWPTGCTAIWPITSIRWWWRSRGAIG